MEKAIQRLRDSYSGPSVYQLTVEGHLDAAMFGEMTGMTISETSDGCIWTLTGSVPDQCALNGLINALYNRRLSVISIVKLSSGT